MRGSECTSEKKTALAKQSEIITYDYYTTTYRQIGRQIDRQKDSIQKDKQKSITMNMTKKNFHL